jgi:hypothetical protein
MAGIRPIIRIELDSRAKSALDKICDHRGMTQVAVMSRLVQWFVRQDKTVQTTVIAAVTDSDNASLARQLLKRILFEDV